MKPPLVLLHGWGVNSRIWDPILPNLNESFELHVLDLPGYGKNQKFTGPYSQSRIVERVLSSTPKQAYWIAWSLGATIAMQAALECPEHFLKIQLVSPTPKFMAGPGWDCGMTSEPLEHMAKQFDSCYEKGLRKFLLLQSTDQHNARHLIKDYVDSMLEYPAPSRETLRESLLLLTQTDLRDQIPRLKTETQVVAGQFDQVVSPLASRWLADNLPGAELITLETGHLPFLDAQNEFLENLYSFAGVPIA